MIVAPEVLVTHNVARKTRPLVTRCVLHEAMKEDASTRRLKRVCSGVLIYFIAMDLKFFLLFTTINDLKAQGQVRCYVPANCVTVTSYGPAVTGGPASM